MVCAATDSRSHWYTRPIVGCSQLLAYGLPGMISKRCSGIISVSTSATKLPLVNRWPLAMATAYIRKMIERSPLTLIRPQPARQCFDDLEAPKCQQAESRNAERKFAVGLMLQFTQHAA